MSRPSRTSDTSSIALSAAQPRPANAAMAADAMGASGSKDALRQLNAAITELKALSIEPILRRAVAALEAEDHEVDGKLAIQALEHDERNGFACYLLARARERAGDVLHPFTCDQSSPRVTANPAEL